MTDKPITLMSEDRWQAITDRAAAGQSTQADADALLAECARLGRLALRWKTLAQTWQEYADGLRRTMLAVEGEIRNEVDR